MRLKNKPWARPFIDSHGELILDAEQFLKQYHAQTTPIYLEIGSGKGNFLIELATHYPNECFFGIERALVAVAISGKKLMEQPLVNAKFVYADFSKLVTEIPSGSVTGIFLNFSDPWPKKRHEKRRLTSGFYLKQYLRILQPGGELRYKTDNQDFYEYTKAQLQEHEYNILVSTINYDVLDTFDAITEYEASFRKLEKPIHRIVARKESVC